jgi:hypothetical protein
MSKSFNIARRPGEGSESPVTDMTAKRVRVRREKEALSSAIGFELGATTRKTIEVPEGYFYQVKLHALKRKMKEKELWAEILQEYFSKQERL